MKSTSLIPPDEAIASMLSLITPVTEIESVPLTAATGRITATPVRSPVDEPSFDNAAMDGYAVRLADISSGDPLQVAGILLAGDIWQDKWPAGCCIRIITGAALPEGSEAVVMQEEAELTAGGVRFSAPVSAGQNIRRKGEDVGSGNTVLKTGVRLGATQLPLLASLGITQLQVYRALKVALFSTGDELQIPGMPLKAGQRYDTNRLAVTLMLRKLGCTVIDMGIIGDNRATREQLNRLCYIQRLPLVSGAAIRMEGQISVFTWQPNEPCYLCMSRFFGADAQSCSETGVMAPLVGVIGAMQAMEAIRLLTHYGKAQTGKLFLYDALALEFHQIKVKPNPTCKVCGDRNFS